MKNLLFNRALVAKKKMFAISMAILFSSLAIATPHLQVKKLAKASSEAAVSIYSAEATDGYIDIVWQGDASVSPVYDIQIALLNTATNDYGIIAEYAYYSSNFAIDGYDGYFSFSSDIVLAYGNNYSTIGNEGATEAQIAEWQTAWEVSVNESDYTLKPGSYIVFVEGFDLSFNTTEKSDYAIVEITGTGTGGINETESEGKELTKKVYLNGHLLIIRNETIYDVLGRRVK